MPRYISILKEQAMNEGQTNSPAVTCQACCGNMTCCCVCCCQSSGCQTVCCQPAGAKQDTPTSGKCC